VLKSYRVVRHYFGNVMLVIKDLPMVSRPWDCINRVNL